MQKDFSKILLFSRNLDILLLDDLAWMSSLRMTDDGMMYALIPAYYITRDVCPASVFDAAFSLKTVDLLPAKSSQSEPRKKVFCTATKRGQNTEFAITNYIFFIGSDGQRYLKRMFEPLILNQSDRITVKTIHALYQQKRTYHVPTEIRKHPYSYAFTDDIIFWYTTCDSPKTVGEKVEAYVCELPTVQQQKRRYLYCLCERTTR